MKFISKIFIVVLASFMFLLSNTNYTLANNLNSYIKTTNENNIIIDKEKDQTFLSEEKRIEKLKRIAKRAQKEAEIKRIKAIKEQTKINKEKEKAQKKNNINHKKKNKQEKQKEKVQIKEKTSLDAKIAKILEEANKPIVINYDYGVHSIMGEATVTNEQALKYLLAKNPNPKLSVTPKEIVDLYYEEATLEGIKPDAAFAQALKETGNFNYGGTVTPDQNNFCGLGTTSSEVKGAYFATAREGVRAHIQHLLAYSSLRLPRKKIVDPRYKLVRSVYGTTTINTWQGLNGRWAVPGNNYGQEILAIVENMKKVK